MIRWITANSVKPIIAQCPMKRIPSRTTKRELNKDPSAIVPATQAKIGAIRCETWNMSESTCCTELMKPISAPVISASATV